MLDMQYLFHHPTAQKWLSSELHFANPPPKNSLQSRPMPSLRPASLIRQLRTSINPLMRNVHPFKILMKAYIYPISPRPRTVGHPSCLDRRIRPKRRLVIHETHILPRYTLVITVYLPHSRHRPITRNHPTNLVTSLFDSTISRRRNPHNSRRRR
jgi:hypothetical protein